MHYLNANKLPKIAICSSIYYFINNFMLPIYKVNYVTQSNKKLRFLLTQVSMLPPGCKACCV